MNVFKFVDGAQDLQDGHSLVVCLPAEITSKDDLFDSLANQLSFPYFGRNWDALDDLLTDLSWVTRRRVAIYHPGLPLKESSKDLRIYLDVLECSVRDWKQHDEHELVVAFHSACELAVARYLKE